MPSQVRGGRIEFFISKSGMDIDNFGPETAAVLIDQGGVLQDVPDIYRIDYRKVLGELSGWEKKILLLEKGVEESKKNEVLPRFSSL